MKPKDKFRIMKDLRLGEVSIVDQPMQDPATIAIMKRADDVAKSLVVTTQTAGHAHTINTNNYSGGSDRIGQTSYVDGHSHGWVVDEAGNIFIADAMGHNHGVAVLTKNQPGEPAPGKANEAGTLKAADGGAENKNMLTTEQAAALQKAADENKARAERAEAILKMNAEQRAHFDTLKGAEADAFLAATNDQREAVVKNLRDANPVVFTSLDGTEYRKSDDARLIKMAREADDTKKALAREQLVRKQAELEKRAADELPNLSGDVVVKAALLGAVDGIADAATRGKVLDVLKTHDAGLGKAFARVGTGAAPTTEGKTAGDQLDAMATEYAKANKVSLADAYSAVTKTEQGANLFAKHRRGE